MDAACVVDEFAVDVDAFAGIGVDVDGVDRSGLAPVVEPMIPVGAIIAGIVVAARVLNEQQQQKSADGTTVVFTKKTFSGRSAAFVLVWLFVWPLWLALLWGCLVVEWNTIAFGVAVALTPLVLPWALTRAIAIPLGLPRIAYGLAHLADWTWGRDRKGGALIAATLAVRGPRRFASAKDRAWVKAKLQATQLLSAGGVVALALDADADDNADDVTRLLATLASFDPRVVPQTARHIAAELTLVRHLARGDVDAALAVDVGGVFGARAGRFLQACAARTAGRARTGGLDDVHLRVLWLLAPRRVRGLPLLRAALSPSSTTTPEPDATPTPTPAATTTSTPALPAALALHVKTTTKAHPSVDEVAALAAAWGPAIDAATSQLQARARELGVVDVDGAAGGVEGTVVAALVSLVERLDLRDVDVHVLPALMQIAVEDVRGRRLDALEIAGLGLRQRAESATDLAPVDELREFAAVQALYDDVARTGADARSLAYDSVQWTVCEIAVRLWNVRHEHRIGNAIFRWLLAEATALGDTRGMETQAANVKCGP